MPRRAVRALTLAAALLAVLAVAAGSVAASEPDRCPEAEEDVCVGGDSPIEQAGAGTGVEPPWIVWEDGRVRVRSVGDAAPEAGVDRSAEALWLRVEAGAEPDPGDAEATLVRVVLSSNGHRRLWVGPGWAACEVPAAVPARSRARTCGDAIGLWPGVGTSTAGYVDWLHWVWQGTRVGSEAGCYVQTGAGPGFCPPRGWYRGPGDRAFAAARSLPSVALSFDGPDCVSTDTCPGRPGGVRPSVEAGRRLAGEAAGARPGAGSTFAAHDDAGSDPPSRTLVSRVVDATPSSGLYLVAASTAVLVLVVLYRRLSRDDVLEHDLRSRLIEVVEAEPGIAASTVAEQLDVATTTVLYHGRVLEEAGVLLCRRVLGRVALLTVDAAEDAAGRNALCSLRCRAKRRVIEALARSPGLSLTEIGEAIDRAPATVKDHVDALAELGVIDDRDPSRRTSFRLTDPAAEAIRDRLEAGR